MRIGCLDLGDIFPYFSSLVVFTSSATLENNNLTK